MIKVQCPTCGVQLSAPPEFAGRTVSCQQCKSKFVVPTTPPAAAIQPSSQPTIVNSPTPAAPTPVQAAPAQAASAQIAPTPSFQPQAAHGFSGPETGKPGNLAIRARAGKGVEIVESHRLSDLFDFRFNKFLTPKLAKTVYLAALLGATIFFCFGTYMFVSSLVMVSSASVINENQSENPVLASQPVGHESRPIQLASLGTPPSGLLGQLDSPFTFGPTASLPSKSTVVLNLVWGYLTLIFTTLLIVFLARLSTEAAVIHFHNGLKLAAIEANTKPS